MLELLDEYIAEGNRIIVSGKSEMAMGTILTGMRRPSHEIRDR